MQHRRSGSAPDRSASSVEPRDRNNPLIATPKPANTAYGEYFARRCELDDRIRDVRERNIAEVFGDCKRLDGVYLPATTLGGGERNGYLRKTVRAYPCCRTAEVHARRLVAVVVEIEEPQAVRNLEEIVAAADAVMGGAGRSGRTRRLPMPS
jgi:hypothetical protein